MATATNIYGFNIGGNNNSFDQRGHFYRSFLDGNVSGMTVKQNSTPNMTVLVEHGSALLNKNTISASIAEIKSNVSVAIDTANTANPRIDSVVIYEDTSVAIPTVEANYWQDGAGGRFKIVSLPGTAGASPVALSDASIQSAIGAGKPFTRLADITVAANSTTIINSNINNSVRNQLSAAISNGAVTAQKIDFSTFKAGSSTNLSGTGAVPMASFVGLATVSFNLTQASQVLIVANVDVLLSTNQEFLAQVDDNGTAIFTTNSNASGAGSVRTRTINHVATLAPGNHTLTIRFRAFNGPAGSWNVVANTCNIAYMVLGH